MQNKYFHLTDCENVAKIMQEGIKANKSGEIYVFTDMLVANTIARDQVFTDRYSAFEINRNGIYGKILDDNVGELSQGYHRIIKQKLIKPEFLKLFCEKDTIHFEPTEWDYYRGQFLGMTRNEVDQQFSEMKKRTESKAAMSEQDKLNALAKETNMDPDTLAERSKFIRNIPDNATVTFDAESGGLKVINGICEERTLTCW